MFLLKIFISTVTFLFFNLFLTLQRTNPQPFKKKISKDLSGSDTPAVFNTMNDSALVIIGCLVLFFSLKWVFSGQETTNTRRLRSRREVSQNMIEIIHTMFPNIPIESIEYDLGRTGSVEATTETLLTHGQLPTPPPSFVPNFSRNISVRISSLDKKPTFSHDDLIKRYDLYSRIKAEEERLSQIQEETYQWYPNKEQREAQLRRKREAMILKARRCLKEKDQQTLNTRLPDDKNIIS